MTIRHAAAVTGSAILLFGLLGAALFVALRTHPVSQDTSLIGVVLTEDTDPRKQQPIPNVLITGFSSGTAGQCKSDASGFFRLNLHPGARPGNPIVISFIHGNFNPLELTVKDPDRLQVARLTSAIPPQPEKANGPETGLSDIRIRYTVKTSSTVDQATVVNTFLAVNKGNVPCNNHPPCSPDGRWKAGIGTLDVDAPEGGQFREVRVSCIAGPCPFTKVESDNRTDGERKLHVSALNWSDTATFLVEADVVHTLINDLVRQSYPVIFGRGMSFTLPLSAAGPSIEAEVKRSGEANSSYVVFPLGPELFLSWATCTATTDPDRSKLYSCELKPGYRFQ